MAKVFISYSSKNRDLVKALAADIDELGHEVWFDKELTGGHAWWDSILQAVRACEVFIFALSPESLDSEPCGREYKYAYALNKTILPVLITGTVSSNLLPRELSLIQYVDYRQADKAATLKLGRAFMALPDPKPLPETLPLLPDVPIAPILGLREQVESPNTLNFEQQTALLFQLREELKNPATRADALELLRRFRERGDILAKVQGQIDELIRSHQAPAAKTLAEDMQEFAQSFDPSSLKRPALIKTKSNPAQSAYAGSILIADWNFVVLTTIVWGGLWLLATQFSAAAVLAYPLLLSPWLIQGLILANKFHGDEKKTISWYLRAILSGGAFAIFQIPQSQLKIWHYGLWFVLIFVFSFVDYYLVNSVAFYNPSIYTLWLGFLGASLGFISAYLFSVFHNIARQGQALPA